MSLQLSSNVRQNYRICHCVNKIEKCLTSLLLSVYRSYIHCTYIYVHLIQRQNMTNNWNIHMNTNIYLLHKTLNTKNANIICPQKFAMLQVFRDYKYNASITAFARFSENQTESRPWLCNAPELAEACHISWSRFKRPHFSGNRKLEY